MELRKEEYSGDIHKKVYVSAEKGRKHIANNQAGRYEVERAALPRGIVEELARVDWEKSDVLIVNVPDEAAVAACLDDIIVISEQASMECDMFRMDGGLIEKVPVI